jgi:hypothetical protein
MNKDLIKVVKRVEKAEIEITQVVVNSTKVESNTQLKTANTIKNWISERRENNRSEKVFSESNILAWKIKSENFNDLIS